MRDSMCPCILTLYAIHVCVCLCVQHWENGAIHRITGRQLFEKKGLYLHKQPWKRKTCRKKDRIREQAKEKGRREDKKIKRRGGAWGVDRTCQATRG